MPRRPKNLDDPPSPKAHNPGGNPNIATVASTRRVWTLAETVAQMAIIEPMYVRAFGVRAITTTLRQQWPGIAESRVRNLLERVRRRQQEEDDTRRPGYRSAQLRRLQQYMEMARGRPPNLATGDAGEKPNFAALARFEKLYSDIAGTNAPVKLDVTVQHQHAIMHVVSSLSADEMTAWLAEYEEMETLANKAKQLGIVVDAVEKKPDE